MTERELREDPNKCPFCAEPCIIRGCPVCKAGVIEENLEAARAAAMVDENRLAGFEARLVEVSQKLLDKQNPIKEEIANLTKELDQLGNDWQRNQKLRERISATYTKFREARSHISQVRAEINDLDADLTILEAEDE